MTPPRILLAALWLGGLAALPHTARAQEQAPGSEATQVLVSRAALEDLAERYEQTAASSAFSSAERARALAKGASVRARLREGDFQIGDRIQLVVDLETTLTRTFSVTTGRVVVLPGVGMMPMTGVLRVELEEYVTRYLSQYLRNPKVQAQALIRLTVIDGVGKQGYISTQVNIPIDSVLQLAGGLTGVASVDRMRIEREGETLYDGMELQRLISIGSTADALSLRQGDRIVVPQTPPTNPLQRIQTLTYLLTIPITIYSLISLFKN